jgi:hypothetical protein
VKGLASKVRRARGGLIVTITLTTREVLRICREAGVPCTRVQARALARETRT